MGDLAGSSGFPRARALAFFSFVAVRLLGVHLAQCQPFRRFVALAALESGLDFIEFRPLEFRPGQHVLGGVAVVYEKLGRAHDRELDGRAPFAGSEQQHDCCEQQEDLVGFHPFFPAVEVGGCRFESCRGFTILPYRQFCLNQGLFLPENCKYEI